MTYQYSIEQVLEWLADPPQATERNEQKMLTAWRELGVRIARYDLDGHNSLNVDRMADRLEAVILDSRRRRRGAAEAEERRVKEEQIKRGW